MAVTYSEPAVSQSGNIVKRKASSPDILYLIISHFAAMQSELNLFAKASILKILTS